MPWPTFSFSQLFLYNKSKELKIKFKIATLDKIFIILAPFLTGAIFAFFQFQSKGLVTFDDPFYHSRFANLIAHGNWQLFTNNPYLQFVTPAFQKTDIYFFHHLALVPFTYWNPILGYKIYSIFLSFLVVLAFWLILVKNKIRAKYFWLAVLIIASPTFVFRLNLGRDFIYSIFFALMTFYVLTTGKYWQLLIVGFFYSLSYLGFILMLGIILTFLLIQIFKKEKVALQALLWTLAGLVLGILTHPGAINYLKLIWIILTATLFGGFHNAAELEPMELKNLLMDTAVVNIFIVSALIGLIIYLIHSKNRFHPLRSTLQNKINSKLVLLFFLALGAFIMTLKSQRFIEYFVPFGLLFVSFVVNLAFDKFDFSKLTLKPWLFISLPLVFTFAFILSFFGLKNFSLAKDYLKNQTPDPNIGISEWLKANTPPKSLVFNVDWSNFPGLFYHNQQNYYATGLDISLTRALDPQIYAVYKAIENGEIQNIGQKVKEVFKINIVIAHKGGHLNNFRDKAEKDPYLERIWEDADYIVYKVK